MLIKRKNYGSRGQSSVEFIITLSMILLVFVSFLAVFEKRDDEFKAKDKKNIAASVAHEVAFNINQISVAPENTNKSFILKNASDDIGNYIVSILPESQLIQVYYEDTYYSYPINTEYIEKKNISSGIIMLSKTEGFIHVR